MKIWILCAVFGVGFTHLSFSQGSSLIRRSDQIFYSRYGFGWEFLAFFCEAHTPFHGLKSVILIRSLHWFCFLSFNSIMNFLSDEIYIHTLRSEREKSWISLNPKTTVIFCEKSLFMFILSRLVASLRNFVIPA